MAPTTYQRFVVIYVDMYINSCMYAVSLPIQTPILFLFPCSPSHLFSLSPHDGLWDPSELLCQKGTQFLRYPLSYLFGVLHKRKIHSRRTLYTPCPPLCRSFQATDANDGALKETYQQLETRTGASSAATLSPASLAVVYGFQDYTMYDIRRNIRCG